jgi:hypothetical protein
LGAADEDEVDARGRTVSTSSRADGRSFGAILFDLILIGFVGLLVVNAFGIRPGAALVPLLIGVPTIVAALIILVLDVFPNLRRATGGDQEGGFARLGAIREAEDEDELELTVGPGELRRQAAFALWVVGFVILAALTNVYVAIPVALIAIFLAVRVPLLHIALIVGVTMLGFYGLFHYLLNIRL